MPAALAVPVASAADAPEAGFAALEDWTLIDAPESAYTLNGAEIAVHSHASFPMWLRTTKEYENFELRGEFHIQGWTDSGIYLRAPEYGRPGQAGLQIKVFHQKEEKPTPYSMGALFPHLAPTKINVREGWNDIRVLCDGPKLQVWTNGELVQDVDLDSTAELKSKFRRGYVGIVAASAECRFRNLRVKELPAAENWETLFDGPEDFASKWVVSEGKPNFVALGGVLRGDGSGHIATKQKYRDLQLRCYIRGSAQHNGGVLFRSVGKGLGSDKLYEIQLHPVEEAHYPTASLYHHKRARYPRIEDEKWFLFDLWVKGREVQVRIDGDLVMEYDHLELLDEGVVELQAHRQGYWVEFRRIIIRKV